MAEFTVAEAERQAVKAGRYFARVLAEHERMRLAFRVGDVVVVVARDVDADELERRVGLAVDGAEAPWMHVDNPSAEAQARLSGEVSEPVTESDGVASGGQARPVGTGSLTSLDYRFHEPQDRGRGSVHLHVREDVTLGRRERKAGECLCSKKHGSSEREPRAGEITVCPECSKVAADHGLA